MADELKKGLSEFVRFAQTLRGNEKGEAQTFDALTAFPLADDYSFGILQSGIHFEWFKARCSTLKGSNILARLRHPTADMNAVYLQLRAMKHTYPQNTAVR